VHGAQIACVVIEPIAGNMNFVRASVPFMKRLRELCSANGSLLIFDEVMTGFRVALGGAQSLYAKEILGFMPDLSVFGKVIGGGMPLAAFGGRREVMEQLAPLGPVYQAGTLSGKPRSQRRAVWPPCTRSPGRASSTRLAERTRGLLVGLLEAAQGAGVSMTGDCEGGMFGFFFSAELPRTYREVMATDKERFNPLLPRMLELRRLPGAGALRGPASSAPRTATTTSPRPSPAAAT